MIKHCWASLWSPEAVSYRTTNGIDHAEVFMAVVVQEMVPSEVSGVTFTANPVTGDLGEVVTESSWGMGAAIVDGRVTPDHWIVSREDFSLKEKRIAEKKYMVPPALDEGQRSRLLEVPLDMRKRGQHRTGSNCGLFPNGPSRRSSISAGPRISSGPLSETISTCFNPAPSPSWAGKRSPLGIEGQYVIFKPIVENFTEPVTTLTGEAFQSCFSRPLMRIIKGWLYVSLKHMKAVLPFPADPARKRPRCFTVSTTNPNGSDSPWFKLPFFLLGLLFLVSVHGVRFTPAPGIFPGTSWTGIADLAEEVDRDGNLDPFAAMVRPFFPGTTFSSPSAGRSCWSICPRPGISSGWAPSRAC